MKINKRYLEVGILVGMLILISSSVSAFAVSSAYWKENPIIISPGETKNIQLILQNMAGTEDISAKGAILEGFEIAQITDADDVYLVPLGQKTPVNIQLSIPEEAEVDDTYELRVSFTTLTTDTGGFGFGSSVERVFPVIIFKEPGPKVASWIIYLAVGILIALIIVFFVLRKKREDK
jgi:hypothetical protein